MANESAYKDYPCDLCGTDDPIEVPYVRLYTRNQPVHICGSCGFVYVRSRRSSEEIARVWNDELYGTVYTAKKHPAMLPRYTYLAGFLENLFDINGLKVCDIGAGEGLFLKYLKDHHDIVPFGIEPSPANCRELEQLGIDNFVGTIEQFGASAAGKKYRADVVTILWTLENCLSCLDMLEVAAAMLPVGGRILVATGSRILVPFKKPLFYYLSQAPADVHCFRFSANALQTALGKAGFKTVGTNRYLDNDVLCVLGEKVADRSTIQPKKDQPLEVMSYFERWHQDTLHYLSEWKR
jgi:2-polyprenyl-3-methyl-5-hydroxy-6-metoxy-1,4-benzoquinol methylase